MTRRHRAIKIDPTSQHQQTCVNPRLFLVPLRSHLIAVTLNVVRCFHDEIQLNIRYGKRVKSNALDKSVRLGRPCLMFEKLNLFELNIGKPRDLIVER